MYLYQLYNLLMLIQMSFNYIGFRKETEKEKGNNLPDMPLKKSSIDLSLNCTLI